LNDALDFSHQSGPRYLHPSPVMHSAANDDAYSIAHSAAEIDQSGVKSNANAVSLQSFLLIILQDLLDGLIKLITSCLLAFVPISPIKYR